MSSSVAGSGPALRRRASAVRHPDRLALKRVVSVLDLSLHGLCPPNPTRSFEPCLAVVVSCLADAVVSGR